MDAELWARLLQQEAEGKLTIPPNFGERGDYHPVSSINGGYVGALIEERDERR